MPIFEHLQHFPVDSLSDDLDAVLRLNVLAAAGTKNFSSRVTADTFDRFRLDADGTHSWGSGGAAADLTLSRSSAGLMAIGGGITQTFAANPSGPFAAGTDNVRIGDGRALGNPVGVVGTSASAGGLTGTYKYAYIEWDASGNHTGLSPITTVVAAANQYTLTIPQQRSGVIARSIVRTAANGSTYFLLHNFASGDHVHQTIWQDNTADGSLGAAVADVDGTKMYKFTSNLNSAYGAAFVCTHPDQQGANAIDLTLLCSDPSNGSLCMDSYGGISARSVTSPAFQSRVTGVNAGAFQYVAYWLNTTDDAAAANPVYSLGPQGQHTLSPNTTGLSNPSWFDLRGGVAGNYITARVSTALSRAGIYVGAANEPYFASNVTYSAGDTYSRTTIPPWRMGNAGGSTTIPYSIDVAAAGSAGAAITWTNALQFDTSGNCTLSAGSLSLGSSADCFIVRDAAQTPALRNGANAQSLFIYGTFTNSGNYERLQIATSAGTTLIRQNQAGTGTARSLQIGTIGAGTFSITTNSVAGWIQSTSQHWIANTDNSFDVGQSGANRPRSIFVGTSISLGTNPAASGDVRLANTAIIAWRNNANGADITGIDKTAGDIIRLSPGNGSVQIGGASASLGFFAVTPAARVSAYTQTYSTATRTHSNPVGLALSGIASSSTGTALVEPDAAYVQATWQQNMRRIQDQHNNVVTDLANLKQLVNSIIDDQQTYGLFQ